jgi:hypothetical protein
MERESSNLDAKLIDLEEKLSRLESAVTLAKMIDNLHDRIVQLEGVVRLQQAEIGKLGTAALGHQKALEAVNDMLQPTAKGVN